jgi:N-acetyl-anhydromuramyl-L-alanine amidase AmpD
MKRFLLSLILACSFGLQFSFAQDEVYITNKAYTALENNYYAAKSSFDKAYQLCPSIPKGVLEAVSYANTHFRHISPTTDPESCTGMPAVSGVMGLVSDGKGYFKNNLTQVSQLSGYNHTQVMVDPEINVLAYARAYESLQQQMGLEDSSVAGQIPILISLSELPDENVGQDFALNSFLYSVFVFLDSPDYQQMCNFPDYNLNLEKIFGKENYRILSSSYVLVSKNQVQDKKGNLYSRKNLLGVHPKSTDYAPALWDQACTDNYSSRGGTAISAITLHTVQGSYAGCIGWFNNCSAHVSAHYVVRSSDGQITQMVLEADKAWHVGSENGYTIGYEHEGYVSDPSWYTANMYASSANLTKDICNSGYGIDPKRCFWGPATTGIYVVNCPKIKGHQNYQNQTHTDPGINWDWDYYYKLVNSARVPTTYTTSSGNFYDTGGSGGDYSNNEGGLWLIQPAGASSVTLTFSSFSVEANWDYMYIYDGNTVFSPLIGVYTSTTSPGTVTASSGAMLIEFRSDCATVGTGWAASWTSNTGTTNPTNLLVSQTACPSNDVVFSWTNSGTGWYIALSTDPTFATYYWKWVSGLTTYTGFTGFVDHVDGTPITYQPGTPYYWYIRANGTNTSGPNFTTHTCSTPIPTNMQVVAPTCANQTASFTWTNSGNNWVIEVSTDSTFTSKSTKSIPSLTSTTAPTGFSPAFYFHNDTKYFWRIFNGTVYTSGSSFTSPMCDTIGPTSLITINGNWQTADFNVDFTDEDDSTGTGVEKSFYQVLDYNGSEWHANANLGFFADNYDATIGTEYQIPAGMGIWAIDNGTLRQSNIDSSNTNIFAPLTQNLSNRYLYHFLYKLNTASGNRRFGFHFFADSGSAVNRGNSYFIWFRANSVSSNYTLEFYKCNWSGTNVFTLENTITNVMTNAGQWYDVKVIYDRITGKIDVYRDNEFLGSWTDPSPLSNGKYVSFRTGNCDVSFDELKIYRSRYPSVTVLVGASNTNMARYQNPDPATYACKVKSIAEDFAGNLSAISFSNVNIDWTPPSTPAALNDGSGADVDTIYTNTLNANWGASTDVNSGIASYYYAIGTTPGDSNVFAWTSSGLTQSASISTTLTNNQIYYYSVKAENGAGLKSAITSSDGQRYVDVTGIIESSVNSDFTVCPNPSKGNIIITFNSAEKGNARIELLETTGRLVTVITDNDFSSGTNHVNYNTDNLRAGVYFLRLICDQKISYYKITVL